MKTKTMFTILSLITLLSVQGCADKSKEITLEITSNSKNAVIQKEMDGIKFKFCLLNENGDSTTSFKEKENIIFSFSLKNNLQDTITFSTDFVDSSFYNVYQINDVDMGKPWTGVWCEFNMSDEKLRLAPSNTKQFNCPWLLISNTQPDYPLCMSESKNYLPAGNYYTKINLGFHYSVNNKYKSIENIKFIINFLVK